MNEFHKQYPDLSREKYGKKELDVIAKNYVNSKSALFDKKGDKKYWIVYPNENEDAESGSVFYSSLVHSHTKEEALLLILIENRACKPNEYDAEEMKPKTVD